MDLIIKNARIIDGGGNPWYRGDIGIQGERIVRIGKLEGSAAGRVIDDQMLATTPGFIDLHGHSDTTLLVNPYAESKVMQGVTTEVFGNCGVSAAPCADTGPDLGALVDPNLSYGMECTWTSFAQYLDALEEAGLSINAASYVGHGTVRGLVMGYADRPPTAGELERMRALTKESIRQGAIGMSTGLVYPPGCYGDTEELIELARAVGEVGGIYVSHIRGMNEQMEEAVGEAIEIGRRGGLPAHISHMSPAPPMYGLTVKLLEMIEEARSRCCDVTCDVIPYTIGCTGLKALCPPWANEGGDEKLVERLKDEAIRQRIIEDTLQHVALSGGSTKRALIKEGRWDKLWLASASVNADLAGKSFQEIAEIRGTDPFTALFDILVEDKATSLMLGEDKDPDDLKRVMRHSTGVVVSDGFALGPKGRLLAGKQHPRSYGTFPRFLGHYVREEEVLPLEAAIHKITSFPAWRLGLRDRGILREGAYADIAIFDPETIAAAATFQEPYQYPVGIEYVLVNGQIVVEKGVHSRARPGMALRSRWEKGA